MASNKMLIDASHPEETRVAVVKGNRIEEFDFESQAKKQLRGNIYLAKVTRVEPSLQAAFIDYGGNRHGFLAFSEIHPDYYQIPLADRQALLEEEASQHEDISDSPAEEEHPRRSRRKARKSKSASEEESESSVSQEELDDEDAESGSQDSETEPEDSDDESSGKSIAASIHVESVSEPYPQDGDADDGDEKEIDASAEGDSETGEDDAKPRARKTRSRRRGSKTKADKETGETDLSKDGDVSDTDTETESEATEGQAEAGEEESGRKPRKRGRRRGGRKNEKQSEEARADQNGESDSEEDRDDDVESVGQEDALEEVPFRRKPRRQYKIQEVIKRRQIMLVQVVKEERGNKGAALTTYLSLAGRYSVLMPNTARGGGISRKITNANDRKRLKTIASELDVQQGMGVILRTAGASRTKAEIKRDFEYLMRLWENVRSLTLSSTAPCLVYEEGSLIKRSIRDLYNKDIGEILVSGEEGYREAKEFMRMLMPSHAKNVKYYQDDQAIFSRFGVEQQLDRLLTAQVTLKSGGYLVINQTEALVSIDVNSGRSTREHSIEDTALQTNLEAADEVSRQLRLRDLAGLIVIDFIDMEEKRNNRAVEKRLKEALKNDRARIQVGRISHFGLLEMSRQRIRAGVMESTMDVCPHCEGSGYVRSDSSIALHVFRSIEEHLTRNPRHDVIVRCPTNIAIDILNSKRTGLFDLESRYGVQITVSSDATLPGQSFAIERGKPATGAKHDHRPVQQGLADAETMQEESDDGTDVPADEEDRDENDNGKRKSSRARSQDKDKEEDARSETSDSESDEDSDRPRRRRRRGKRGGRRNRRDSDVMENEENAEASDDETDADAIAADAPEPVDQDAGIEETEDHRPANNSGSPSHSSDVESDDEDLEATRGRATRRPKTVPSRSPDKPENVPELVDAQNQGGEETDSDKGKKRTGWWSRGGGFF